jgi:uncharacterized protein (DUF1778 family)
MSKKKQNSVLADSGPADLASAALVLTKESAEMVLGLIENPPEPTPAIRRLFSGG